MVFLGLDFIWLRVATKLLYKPEIGHLLLDKPNIAISVGFYLLYVIGIIVLVVMPAHNQGSWLKALGAGALFGLVAYGTYDMTNLATLKDWSITVSLIDMAWGTTVTALAATAGYFVLKVI